MLLRGVVCCCVLLLMLRAVVKVCCCELFVAACRCGVADVEDDAAVVCCRGCVWLFVFRCWSLLLIVAS